MHRSARAWAIAVLAIGLASVATPVAAHIVKQVGPYTVALGWVHEPTYVGQLNGVQVVIKDAKGNPVSDLSADDLKVVVSTAGQQSDPMSLAPTFDEDTGLGIPGDYEAPMIPTAPGDYTFHVTGTIPAPKSTRPPPRATRPSIRSWIRRRFSSRASCPRSATSPRGSSALTLAPRASFLPRTTRRVRPRARWSSVLRWAEPVS